MADTTNKAGQHDMVTQLMCIRRTLWQLLHGIGLIALSANLAVAESVSEATGHTVVPLMPYMQNGTQNIRISLSDLPPELQGEGKWETFKSLWRALDAIEPVSSGVRPFDGKILILFDEVNGLSPMTTNFLLPEYSHRLYYQALDAHKREDFQENLHDIFGNDIEQLSPESKLLYRLTWLRIQELSSSERFTPDYTADEFSTMTRMGPTYHTLQVSPTYYLVGAVDRIQMRANVLVELRNTGAIQDEIYASTLDALIADAKLALYLDALTGQPQYMAEDKIGASLFGAHDMAPIALNSVDFTKPDISSSDKIVDLREIQTWQEAANSAYNRKEDSNHYHGGATEQIKALIQELSVLRQNLDRLDTLLTELER